MIKPIEEYLKRFEIALEREYGRPVDITFLNWLERALYETYKAGIRSGKSE